MAEGPHGPTPATHHHHPQTMKILKTLFTFGLLPLLACLPGQMQAQYTGGQGHGWAMAQLGPINNDCSAAIVVPVAYGCVPVTGTTTQATQSVAPITCNDWTSSVANDVWFAFTATGPDHRITVSGSGASDPVVDVRTGNCDGSNIACADATEAGGTEVVTLSGLTTNATYLVRVYCWTGCPSFTICVQQPDCQGVYDGPVLPGTPCDDGDACTTGDVWSAGCACVGTFLDTDGDGTCDAEDGCPNDPNKTAPGVCGCGTADVPTTWYADADGDGLGDPDAPQAGFTCNQPPGYVDNDTDPCPDLAFLAPGDVCDDGNSNTTDDVLTEDCVCVGQPVGIGETPAESLWYTVRPNPSDGRFLLTRVDGPYGAVTFTVLDPSGRVVESTTATAGPGTTELDLGDAANGVYMLRMAREGAVQMVPIVVQR